MYAGIGIAILFGMVFGGFAITGGALGPVMEAIPHELLIILGAAAGALVTGNNMHGLKALGGGFAKVFKGPKHNKLANHALTALIADTLTLIVVSSGTLEVHAVEDVMDNAIKTHLHELHEPQHAIQNLADALPALGIVAAVLGVVKTMGSIDKPPSILGAMIGSALVGTFMGVLLAYGMVAPMAGRLKQIIEADEQIFHAVKQVIIASLHGWPQPLVVESARSGLGHDFRPGLSELLDALRGR